MPQTSIFPRLGEHMCIIGMTGSGKTTAATLLLATAMKRHIPVGILDTKGEKEFTPLRPMEKLDELTHDLDIIVYRPGIEDLADREELQAFLLTLYNRPRSGIVYVDELSSLGVTDQRPGSGLLSLLARGREHIVSGKVVHTSLITSTQRPRRIPQQAITESTHVLVFTLTDRRDRERVAEFSHPTLAIAAPWHSFWYWRRGRDRPRLLKFALPGATRTPVAAGASS